MKKFSEKTQLITFFIAILGFSLLGLSIKLTIIGICLFIPLPFVQSYNFMVENKLNIFKFTDSIKFIEAILKGKIWEK